jgi:2-dehydro-3-deoxygalactonokinase
MTTMTDLPWLACVDWGTSRLRVRLLHRSAAGSWRLAGAVASDEGAGVLAASPPAERPARYAAALARRLTELQAATGAPAAVPVVVSGMAGSSLGWRDLPYAVLPWGLDGSSAMVDTAEPRPAGASALALISGVRSADDILRGEETELAGLHALSPGSPLWRDGWVLLPGTHSKHCRVREGSLVGFRTAMTGELFAVLVQHSVLRQSVAESDGDEGGGAAFAAGVERGAAEPLATALFGVRARAVLERHPASDNREFLSGVVIGSELAGFRRDGADGAPIAVAGEAALARRYRRALEVLGLANRLRDVPVASADGVPAGALGAAAIFAAQCGDCPALVTA